MSARFTVGLKGCEMDETVESVVFEKSTAPWNDMMKGPSRNAKQVYG